MTANDLSIPEDVYQSFSRLSDDVSASLALAHLFPVDDYDSTGELVRVVARALQSDFQDFQSVLFSEFVNR